MPYSNKKEQKRKQQEYYQKNKELYRQRMRKRRKEIRDWISAYKTEKGCSKCGEKHPAVLDFHHTEDNKELGLAAAVSKQWSQKRLENEANKCEILCSNCHRIVHWELRKQDSDGNVSD